MKRPNPMTLLPLLLICAGAADLASAQRMYKYLNADGVWVYSDRQPAGGQEYQEESIQRTFEAPEVRVTQTASADGLSLVAENTYFGAVQVAYQLDSMQNVAPGTLSSGRVVLPARSETEILKVSRDDLSRSMSFDYQYQYIPGDPDARHTPHQPYRLPYSAAESYLVSQSFPQTETHGDSPSRYAVDFAMPIGTRIYAARAGTVIEVASDYYQSGTNLQVDGPRANIVRIYHDDGTMSLYAHLNWNSIRVVPGQRIQRGEYIADSGNTGFSTGPHLHFVVQANLDGSIVSLPIEFSGRDGRGIALRSGDRPTAY